MTRDRLSDLAALEQLFGVTFDAEQIEAYVEGRITIRELVQAILNLDSEGE